MWKELSALWKRPPIKHHESLEGWHHRNCHHCCRKSCESHQVPNNKILLQKIVSRCWAGLHRIYGRANQETIKDVDVEKKVGSDVAQDTDVGKIQKVIGTAPEKLINRIWYNRDDCFTTSARWLGRKYKRSRARRQIDIEQSGRWIPIIQDCFWLPLWHGPFYDADAETTANSRGSINTI